jgi:long-chain acyl-CoA synthetase
VILEGYGLTETSPLLSVNTPEHFRLGTVGRPVSGVDLRIAPDGEILARGPNVMRGYYKNAEATAEAIDPDGWFHTGDIGELRDEFLAITDRKKDIIVTAGGKNIAPQPIEHRVRSNKFVDEAVMIGDRRKFPALLVVPDWNALEAWGREAGVTWPSRAAALEMPAVREKMEAEVRGTHTELAHYETPRKIALLEHEFSQERGELTASLKVRRRVVDKLYKPVIDALYS